MTEIKLKRRKQLFIDRKVQGGLALRIAMHWLLFLVMTLALNLALRLVSNIDNLSLIEMVTVAFRDQAPAMLVLLALLPWFVKDAIQLSHRVVGPVLRMRSAIRQLTNADELSPVVLRHGDFFGELAEEFNELQAKICRDRKELQRLRAELANQSEYARTIELPIGCEVAGAANCIS